MRTLIHCCVANVTDIICVSCESIPHGRSGYIVRWYVYMQGGPLVVPTLCKIAFFASSIRLFVPITAERQRVLSTI